MARDKAGKLAGNSTRFPSGIAHLADYAHGKKLKLGIYEDVGTLTCDGYPGLCTVLLFRHKILLHDGAGVEAAAAIRVIPSHAS
jgi:hypothetical protein